jgi:hypothetical protein
MDSDTADAVVAAVVVIVAAAASDDVAGIDSMV